MESDNETNQLGILQQLSQKNNSDDLDNNNDCLTDAFITIYESSLWQNETINSIDMISMNNSAREIFPKKMYRELPRHHLSMMQKTNRLPSTNSRHSRSKTPSKIQTLSSKTRVTVRSISNQNLNRAQSNHTSALQEKNPSNTLGTINSHITVVPVKSSHCQNRRSTNNFKQIENMNLREQLADALCRRSYEPLTFINHGICCGHCRPLFFPNVPFHHSGYYFPPHTPQTELNNEGELLQKSKQSPQMGDASETQSTAYSASPNIPSHLTESPEDQLLSTDAKSHNETSEPNQSVLSFPEHDVSPVQESEELMDEDNHLKLNAQRFVDDSIQNAREKYQKILQMSTSGDLQNNTLTTIKQITKDKSKSASISNEPNPKKLSDDNVLCQELCNKLNLSDSNQISEIIHILASNAPHILKEQPSNNTSILNDSYTNKDNENTLCRQLLLHPPFKPKRLIHLCPDGNIQVLSAVNENSNENQIINQQQYCLNYSNSAITSSIQQKHILTNESSLALIDVETNFNHLIFTESTSTEQSHSKNEIHLDHLVMDNNLVLSLQQKKTLFKYDNPLTLAKDVQLNSDSLKTVSENDDPIVKINLDINDETIEGNSDNDEKSLPELFFKRIVAPENSITPFNDDKEKMRNVRRKNRHTRSRSYTNKKTMNVER